MLINYIKIAFRNLWKRKAFTSLNIIGLSVAFGVAILLCMAALFELSYDKFHKNIGSIYQVYTTHQTPKGAEANTSYPVPFSPALKAEVPGVKNISRFTNGISHVAFNKKELSMNVASVDPDFFSIFSYPAIKGNINIQLQKKSDVAITEDGAKKLFNTSDVIGKTILITVDEKEQPFTIAAVLKDFPAQSTFKFDMAINFENDASYKNNIDKWDNRNHDVYLQLEDHITAEQFEKSSRAFSNLHFKDDISSAKRDGAKPDASGQYQQIQLLPYEEVHFTSYDNGLAKISRSPAYTIVGISLLILFIACINFINMSIGSSVQRLREIGMRKTLGAAKGQLFLQFWGESVLVFSCSLLAGFAISQLLLEQFKTLFRIQASLNAITTPPILIGFILSFILITLIAGGYPAFLLSKLDTLQSLKGKLDSGGRNRLRNSLIVIQFSIAILLISGTLVLWSQLLYMQHKDLGFNKEQVIAFAINGKKSDRLSMQLLRNELQNQPGIVSISASDNILGRGKDGSAYNSVLGFEYKGREVKTNMLVVDYDYPKTLDMQLVAGRNFSKQFGNDSLALVINETMAKELGEKDPLNAQIFLADSVKYSIIGIMKDYHFQGLDKKIEPITMFMKTDWSLHYAYVKVAPQNLQQSLELVKNTWAKIEPNAEFTGSFLDENIDRTLRQEKVMTTIITSGAVIAIVLSCVGLFAISLLVVAQRTKEIGVRKVVGASVSSITILLSKDFLKLVVIALFIATPIAWFAMSKWLEGYAYRINLSAWFFIAAGVIAVLIALVTISIRTIKAALANPVKSLRTE
jgi:putative ABC transport system permease protein